MTRAARRRGTVATMIVLGIAATVGGVVAGSASAGARTAAGQPVGCGPDQIGATVTTAPPPTTDCTLAVTKVVTGKAAPGTTFSVGVDCEPLADRISASTDGGQTPPFTTTLTFGENGGAEDVLISRPASCTVTEDSLPPGCTLTSIEPKQPVVVETTEPVEVTVTNDCQVAPTPTTVPAAQPVPPAPVVAAPLFTG